MMPLSTSPLRVVAVISLYLCCACSSTTPRRSGLPGVTMQETPSPAAAQETPPTPPKASLESSAGGFKAFDVGIGFTDDPDTFLTVVEADFYLKDNLFVAPLLQIGVDDENTIFAPTVGIKGEFPAGSDDRLRLHALAGIGLVYIEKENRRGDDDDVGFLFNVGFGGHFQVSDETSIGSTLLFNVMPDDVVGENYFFSWKLISVKFRF